MTVQEVGRPLRSPTGCWGGKGLLAARLVDLLPPHDAWVEPFFGGGSVFFRKPPAALETVNDIHDAVVGFYRVVRDPEQYAAFCALADLTPYARVEYEACRATWQTEPDSVRRAWAWFVTIRQSFGGYDGARGSWGYRATARDGAARGRWPSCLADLPAIHERLRHVQIEHGDWRAIVARYNAPDALLYADPPYLLETRTGGNRYAHEMSMADHADLTAALLGWRGMAVLSGYRYDAIHAPLEAAGWERVDMDVAVNVSRQLEGLRRVESVWSNPAAITARRQPSLFSKESAE
jgi:DNA adenine methylase